MDQEVPGSSPGTGTIFPDFSKICLTPGSRRGVGPALTLRPTSMTEPTVAYRICPLCEACCGLTVELRDGRVAAVRGDREDVFSAGYLCPKGVALRELHEDPDRVREPLVKRDGRFVTATWDEAFAEIERRLPPILARSGRDAAALAIGNPTVHKMGLLLYVTRLARALGTRNVFSASTLDQMPKQLSSGLLFGHWLSIPVPDIERCDFLLVLGANPVASNGSLWTVPDFRGKARALRARGGQLVVIDPRKSTPEAVFADAQPEKKAEKRVWKAERRAALAAASASASDCRRAVQPCASPGPLPGAPSVQWKPAWPVPVPQWLRNGGNPKGPGRRRKWAGAPEAAPCAVRDSHP